MFDQIKDKIAVYEEAGVEERKKSICPLCQYKQKTFYAEHYFFICHHCKAKGDVFDFVRLRDGLEDDTAAMRQLADRLGLEFEFSPKQKERHEQSVRYRTMAERFAMLPPEAILYCKKRGLTDETIVNKLIGHIPPEEMERDEVTGLPGILHGRLVIPFWQNGNIVYYTGRALADEKPKYLNQKGEKQYCGTVKGPILYVTEGPFDQLLAEQAGYNCIALAGSGKMPYIKPSVKKIILAFDGDKSGREFAAKHGLPLCDLKLQVFVLPLPEGTDLADYIKEHGTLDGLEPVPLVNYYMDDFTHDPRDQERKENLYRAMGSLDELAKDEYFKKIKELRKCTIQAVRKDYSNFTSEEKETKLDLDGHLFSVPEGYRMTVKGIVCDKGHLTYEPYYIARTGRNRATGVEYVETVFGEKRRITERRTVSISSMLVEESNHGAPVNSSNALALVKYLDAWLARNKDVMGDFEVINSLGWIDHSRFALPDRILPAAETDLIYRGSVPAGSYSKHGTLQGWIDTIKYAGEHPDAWLIRCMLYAGFASSVLERIGQKPFILHVHGDTSTGKSTAMMIPASIYGCPDYGKAMIRWKNTQNFIIRHAENLKNLPLILDELSTENREHESTIYMLESGLSKGKALKDDPNGVAPQRMFSMGVFSSGEIPILGTHSKGGALVRTWEFMDSPFGDINCSEKVDKIKAGLLLNHGWAIDEFIKQVDLTLYKGFEFTELSANEMGKKRTLAGSERRVLTAMNPFYVTGEIVNQIFNLGWPVLDDIQRMAQRVIEPLRNGTPTLDAIMEEVQSWVATYPGAFPVAEPGMSPAEATRQSGSVGTWGYIYKNADGTQDLAIIQKRFIEMFDNTNQTKNTGKAAVNILYGKGKIKEKRKMVKLWGRSVPCVYIPSFFTEDDPFE